MLASTALQPVAAFFSAYSLSQASAALASLFKYASIDKYCKHFPPADLLYFTRQLNSLLTTAFSPAISLPIAQATIEDNPAHWYLSAYEHYCGWHTASLPWHFFPRHLTCKEYLSPQKAINKVCKYQPLTAWHEDTDTLLTYALSSGSIIGEELNILKIEQLLYKLIEAFHLIEIRVIKDNETGPRPKWKNSHPPPPPQSNHSP